MARRQCLCDVFPYQILHTRAARSLGLSLLRGHRGIESSAHGWDSPGSRSLSDTPRGSGFFLSTATSKLAALGLHARQISAHKTSAYS